MTLDGKLSAKIANERVKLIAGLLNSLAGATIIGGFVTAFVAKGAGDVLWAVLVIGFGALLHLLGHLALDFLRLEQ